VRPGEASPHFAIIAVHPGGRTETVAMKQTVRVAVVLCAALGSLPAAAQWTAKAEAGVVATRGNSDADSTNTKFDIAREFVKWKQAFGASGVYASDSAGATAQRWEARAQSDYDFHEHGFWFGSGRHEEDRVSGFEYQRTFGTGLGWRFYDDEITRLITQVGVGYKTFTTRAALADDGISVIPRMQEEDVVAYGNVDFERQLTPTTKILDKLLIEAGRDNVFVQNELSLQVSIMSALALALGYTVRYNTDPPSGFTTTDTLTTLNLVYELD
jgi:putative salt-induced outer membrane protein